MSAARPHRREALGLLGASALGGCGDRDAASRPLRFWGMGREGEVVGQLLPAFHQEHPDIRVTVQQLPWTAAHEKLLTAFAGDSLPDVGQVGNTWLAEMAAIGAIAPLDARVAASALPLDDYFPGVLDSNRIGGRLMGAPWYADTRLLFYNRAALARAGFQRPPTTWAEWREMLAAVKRPGGYGVLLPLNEYEPLLALAVQQPEPLLKDNATRGNFLNAGFLRTLEFYRALFADGLAPTATNTEIANLYQEFERGLFHFYISGPWNIGEFKRRLPASMQGDWATAQLPGPSGLGSSVAGGSSLVLFARSSRQAEAWKLVEFLQRPQVQRRFHALTGDLPARRSSWADPTLAGDLHTGPFLAQLESALPAPKAPEWERICQEMRVVSERMIRGEFTPRQAAGELNARADRFLEKRRWMVERGRG